MNQYKHLALIWFTLLYSLIVNFKAVTFAKLSIVFQYYVWIMIEALLLVFPFPDPKDSYKKSKDFCFIINSYIFRKAMSKKSRAISRSINLKKDFSDDIENPIKVNYMK